MLENLDILEEYPKLYTRREEEIVTIRKHRHDITVPLLIDAWTYFLTDYQPSLLEKPFLDKYSSSDPSHNLPYVARYVRDKAFDHRSEVKVSVPS